MQFMQTQLCEQKLVPVNLTKNVTYSFHREYLEHALQIYSKVYGNKHHSVAEVLWDTGRTWDSDGDNEKAISCYEKALAIQQEIYGPKHHKVSLIDRQRFQ